MRALTIAVIMAFITYPAYAGDPVKPPQKTHSLEILNSQLEAEKAQQATLARKAKKAEKNIAAAKSDMVELSSKIRKNESSLEMLERRVQELTIKESEIKKKLEDDHGSIATTILALERMRRTPPELMIVRPGAPLQTAQTALLLQNLLPALGNRAQMLSRDIAELHQIQERLTEDQKDLLETRKSLEEQKAELARLMDVREKEFKTVHTAYKASAARAEQIAAEAKSLADLVARIEEENNTHEEAPPKPQKKARSLKPGKIAGKGIWPVSGKPIARFGDRDEMGALIQGIKIQTSPRSVVVTPMEGTVKYSGVFRNYGQLVIIEHGGGYHSLIAGLAQAHIGIGQTVRAGEPLGYMLPSSSQDASMTLYYELRRKGEPVDPSYLFADLKS